MDDRSDPEWDMAAEETRLEQRRQALRDARWCRCFHKNRAVDGRARVGLALSGGGIRSATFSLGLLRSLSEAKLIHSIDYLSTVSGGGYAGSFFCSLFVPKELRGRMPSSDETAAVPGGATPAECCAAVAEELGCDPLGSPVGRTAISQLRQGGHYLAPNGTSDAIFAAVIGVRNWFAVAITAGLAMLAFFLLVNAVVLAVDQLIPTLTSYFREFGFKQDRLTPWPVMLIVLAFWPAACAWAYWFARSGEVPRHRVNRLFSMQTLVAVLVFALAYLWPGSREGWHLVLRNGILAISVLAFVTYAAAEFVSYRREADELAGDRYFRVDMLTEEDRVRDLLSRWLLTSTVAFLAVAALAGIHELSMQDIASTGKGAFAWVNRGNLAIAAALLAVGTPVARWLVMRDDGGRSRRGKAAQRRRLRNVVTLILGIAFFGAYLLFWATMASGAAKWIRDNTPTAWKNLEDTVPAYVEALRAYALDPLGIDTSTDKGTIALLVLITIKVGVVAYLIGNVDSLLNRSSFAAFYSGRLRTAYLGATNRNRAPEKPATRDAVDPVDHDAARSGEPPPPPKCVDQDDFFDEITMAGYYHDCVLAPIHLINVTINETTSKTSRVIQRDRKGKSMTVAPAGYLYPPGAPGDGLKRIKRRVGEDLPLSSWIAISGAAFSTGAGSHTSLGTAMLASLTNLRLGYWWRRDCTGAAWRLRRPGRTVQAYLLRELRASYDGTDDRQRWYLSDGGHYENTGVYELVRRKVPFIIASDNGADRYYEFADLVNLIRKVRIDFGAEIEFLGKEELDGLFGEEGAMRETFGTLDQIRASGKRETLAEAEGRAPKPGRYATLARIIYPRDQKIPPGTLLLIKPRITGNELPDLIQYRETDAAFPQQPTTNQFFDEAQWESYYRLGQLIGDRIFAGRDAVAQPEWKPWELRPLA